VNSFVRWEDTKDRKAAIERWRDQPMHEMKSKSKYTQSKTRGKYKSSSNDSTRRRAGRHKVSDKRKLEILASQPKVTLVLLPSGKRRFVREAR
jgi:hypothetical protein